jgi:hypothetical protein
MARPKDWTITALDPFDPTGVRTWTLRIPQATIEWVTKSRLDAKFYRLKLVNDVVADPVAVFQGWQRPERDDDLCYIGRPERDYPAANVDVPAPKGMVFLVFVTKSGVLSDWRWERSDPHNPNFPEDWKDRFGRQLWPQDSP